MAQYTPPLRDMQFVLHELLDAVPQLKAMPEHHDLDAETMNAVLEEGGKFAAEVLLPLNQSGDREGCVLDLATHEVRTPKGFKEAYAKYVEGGWPALSTDPAFGGQGLPHLMNQCFYEMLNSANQAWTMYPGLSHGAYECLHVHGTPEQKALYLPKLSSGVWTGTMCLTESHCGTDLGMLRSKAEPQADGSWKITGNKIFISSGEHDMAENIVHLVLARVPDAPSGSKGHLALRGTEVQRQHRRLARRAQRRHLRRARGEDGHPRQFDLPDQPRRRKCHAGRAAEQGLAGDVRDDECGAPGCRQPVARTD